jgi:hypothetical protein
MDWQQIIALGIVIATIGILLRKLIFRTQKKKIISTCDHCDHH